MGFKAYVVIGRRIPKASDPTPPIYRMRIFAPDEIRAKSRYFYFMSQLRKVKKANAEVLAVHEVSEKSPTVVKTFAIWCRYMSRTGTSNMYKEYRDVSAAGAVDQLYSELASRHRARKSVIQVVDVKQIKSADARRAQTKQFLKQNVSFPITRRTYRAHSTKFLAKRPSAFLA